MKKFTLFLGLIIPLACLGQTNIESLLDSVIVRTKQTSMYASQVNWDSLSKHVYSKAINATSINDLKPAFEALLNGIGDKHGKIINAKTYLPLASFTDFENLKNRDHRVKDGETWSIINDTSSRFSYRILEENVGYLKIVGIAPNVNIEAESKKIREAVIALTNKGVESWVIDLRYNGGGNMHPMVSGIAPIIGDGIVGSLIDLEGEELFNWEIKEGKFIYAGYQAVTLDNLPKFKRLPKVAILTSRWTVSSGEIVATCFKGRSNTKFFGEATGGYTTNNSWEIVNNEVIVVISTGIFSDRNGNSYPLNIPVNQEITFEVVKNIEDDHCISEAITWLKQK